MEPKRRLEGAAVIGSNLRQYNAGTAADSSTVRITVSQPPVIQPQGIPHLAFEDTVFLYPCMPSEHLTIGLHS